MAGRTSSQSAEPDDSQPNSVLPRMVLGALGVVGVGTAVSFVGAVREEEKLTEALSQARDGSVVAGEKGIQLKRKFKSKVSLVKLKKADIELSVIEVRHGTAEEDETRQKSDARSSSPDDPATASEEPLTGRDRATVAR